MEHEAFAELIHREHAGVYRAAARVFRQKDSGRAEDVAQSVFLRVLEGRLDLSHAREPSAVLRHFAVRLALEELRRSRSRSLREDRSMLERNSTQGRASNDPTTEELEEREAAKLVAAELEGLEDKLRVPLVLRFREEWTLAEIGTELGCSESTAHSRIEQGVERLRVRLARTGLTGATAGLTRPLKEMLAVLPSPAVPSGLNLKLLALRGELSVGAGLGFASWAALAGLLLLTLGGAAIFLGTGPQDVEESKVESASALEQKGSESPARAVPPTRFAEESPDPVPRRAISQEGDAFASEPVGEVFVQSAGGAVLRGRFVDRDGAPLSDLPLRLQVPSGKGGSSFRLEGRTASTGDFEFTLLPKQRGLSRRFDLMALPQEARSWSQAVIDLEPDEVRELGEVRLGELSAHELGSWRVELQLVDAAGTPLVGVEVLAFAVDQPEGSHAWNSLLRTHSDEHGRCTLEGERVGLKRIEIDGRRRGFCAEEVEISALAGLTRELMVVLRVGLSIDGLVTDTEGQFARHVVMNVQPIVDGEPIGFDSELAGGISAEDGRFLIRGLDPGAYEIQFTGQGWSTARVRADAGTRNLPVQLKRRDDLREVGQHEAELHGTFLDASGEALEVEEWCVDTLPVEASASNRFLTDVLPNAIWPAPKQVAMIAQSLDAGTAEQRAAEEERKRIARLQFHETGLDPGSWLVLISSRGRRGYAGPLALARGEVRTGIEVPAMSTAAVKGRVLGLKGEVLPGRTVVLFTGTGPESEARVRREHQRLIDAENDRGSWVQGGALVGGRTGTFLRTDVPERIEFRLVALNADYQPTSLELPASPERWQNLVLRFTRRQ